jgi:hypothetical protein
MASHRPGGGIQSRQVKQTSVPKTEPVARKVNPAAADYQGQALAFKPPPLIGGRGYNPPVGPTDNVAAVGVGGGRTLYGQAGTQATHGPVAPGEADRNREAPGSRDILREYGPESSRPGPRNR